MTSTKDRMEILETVVAVMEHELDRMHELMAIITSAPEVQHAIAVHRMQAQRKEVKINDTVKYELSEFAKANYGTGYTKD